MIIMTDELWHFDSATSIQQLPTPCIFIQSEQFCSSYHIEGVMLTGILSWPNGFLNCTEMLTGRDGFMVC